MEGTEETGGTILGVCQKAGLSAGASAGITGVVVPVGLVVGLCLYFLVSGKRKRGSVA